jgi:hypothetical protein
VPKGRPSSSEHSTNVLNASDPARLEQLAELIAPEGDTSSAPADGERLGSRPNCT